MKLWKSIKAISSIIAVIILIAITVAGGLLVFALMTSTLTGGNQKTQVNFESLSLYRSTGEPEVLFATTIKNTGNRPIKQLTVKVYNESDYTVPSVTASTPLEPGRTVGVTLTPPKITAERYVVGNAYSVTVEAEAVDGSTFSTVASVKCLGTGKPSAITSPQTEEKFEYNNNYFYSDAPTGDEWYGQTFTPQIRHKLSKIVFYGQRIGEPTGNFIVSVRATDVDGLPTGEDLVVKSVLASSISPELGEIEIVFDTQITLEVDTQYAIVLRNPGGDSDNNILLYYCDDVYPRGIFVESADCGETWIISSPSLDFWFEEWGY